MNIDQFGTLGSFPANLQYTEFSVLPLPVCPDTFDAGSGISLLSVRERSSLEGRVGGLDILPRIKETTPPPIVVVLTNFSTSPLRAMCARKGADFFFDKSTEFEKAIAVVESVSEARTHALS